MTIYIRIQSITFKLKLKVIRLHLLLQELWKLCKWK